MIKMNITGGSNLSDADVTVNDVAYGKTIYDKTGNKITGINPLVYTPTVSIIDNILDSAPEMVEVNKIYQYDSFLIALGQGQQIAYSEDNGFIWNPIDLGINKIWNDIGRSIDYNYLVISTDGIVCRPTDPGYPFNQEWVSITSPSSNACFLAMNGQQITYAIEPNGYYWEYDNNNGWNEPSGQNTLSFQASTIKQLSTDCYVALGGYNANKIAYTTSFPGYWTEIDSYYPLDIALSDDGIYALITADDTQSYDMRISVGLEHWTIKSVSDEGFTPSIIKYNKNQSQFIINDLYSSKLLVSADTNCDEWITAETPFVVRDLYIVDNGIVIVSQTGDLSFTKDYNTWSDKVITKEIINCDSMNDTITFAESGQILFKENGLFRLR